LLALTKETYLASLVVVLAGLALIEGRLRSSVVPLAAVIAIEAAAAAYSGLRFQHFLALDSAAGAPYRVDLSPASVISGFGFYARRLLSLPVALLIAAAFSFSRGNRRRVLFGAVGVAAGLAALLPHAVLPEHRIEEYAWVAAPLAFLPLLLVPNRLVPNLLLAAGLALSLWQASGRYQTPERQWAIEQEQANGRILASFETLRRLPGDGSFLVTGVRAAHHPWLSSDFIRHEFGNTRLWTVLTLYDAPHRMEPPVTLALPALVLPGRFDRTLEYDSTGAFQGEAPDAELIPELRPHLTALESDPADFRALLAAGVVCLEWGETQRAQEYLERAAAADAANPYPYFFLGQISERQRDLVAARAYFQLALARDSAPRNPAFQQAVDRTAQR
jgi:hypothetical protein